MKQYYCDIDIAHLISYNEELAHKLTTEPADIIPLVSPLPLSPRDLFLTPHSLNQRCSSAPSGLSTRGSETSPFPPTNCYFTPPRHTSRSAISTLPTFLTWSEFPESSLVRPPSRPRRPPSTSDARVATTARLFASMEAFLGCLCRDAVPVPRNPARNPISNVPWILTWFTMKNVSSWTSKF